MKFISSCISLVIYCAVTKGDLHGSKEWVPQSKGSVWPEVRNQQVSSKFFEIKLYNFNFSSEISDCKILEYAFNRYRRILEMSSNVTSYGHEISWEKDQSWKKSQYYMGHLTPLKVTLTGECLDEEYPSTDMDEKYDLEIGAKNELKSKSVWGILRGLETFSQLTYLSGDDGSLLINQTSIQDWPRFHHRGLLLDTSRHYIPKQDILHTLDAMAYNKLNVFHWHLTDLQSFPYKSSTFPELSEKGAWHPDAIYDPKDVQEIIEYARRRGIRVLPEFDTPGHTASWGDSHKEILTPCYKEGQTTGHYGPLDVTKNETYSLVTRLLKEVSQVFPEQYLHVGGDEVDFDCWESNPDINNFMEENNMTGNYPALESYYMQQIIDAVHSYGKKTIVWEEVFQHGVNIPQSTVVQVWKPEDSKSVLTKAVEAGKYVLLSACYYLDVSWKGLDWIEFYKCDPADFDATEEQKQKLVLGGEVALWAEYVNENNLDTKLWPRASAGAERLWADIKSPVTNQDLLSAATRLEEHVCRMIKRGIGATPASGPNYCL